MNKQEAERFIQQVFRHPFDDEQFARFAAEILNDMERNPSRHVVTKMKDAYQEHVRHYRRLGTYTDPNGEEVDVLVVHLKKGMALERARTMQRNFVAQYLRDQNDREAALVAYYSEERADWRVSLVRMDYKLVQDDQGRIKAVEELTPARRFSFLVGKGEPSHTAQRQFLPLLMEDSDNPTLDALEATFHIETVTKEFFAQYKALFLSLKEALTALMVADAAIYAEFTAKGVDTGHFAKKLLGQIVFLYFVQKKGWLGVVPHTGNNAGDDIAPPAWGSGDQRFLRTLLEDETRYTNYFNDILEPLFYEALAVERPGHHYATLNCLIPFLNGGLFEPLAGYDWQSTDITLDNDLFQQIFDTFDLYNFTVRENEPLDKEVAVDPEMLGKVFENLLEVDDRKSKGAFYTPREIVQYMCQESLINYLDTTLNLCEVPLHDETPVQVGLFGDVTPIAPPVDVQTVWERQEIVQHEALALFIRKGERARQHDAAKEAGTKTGEYQVPERIRQHAAQIDQALAEIKVCDPAIGSGAFPVGMMQEIVRARDVLTTYLVSPDAMLGDRLDDRLDDHPETSGRTAYALKRHAIQESIYGVDIDAGAVDIAKLRLWLSLVVDEEDYQTIKPLPNLEYKIVCGDSLAAGLQMGLLNQAGYDELERLKPQFMRATDPATKAALRTRINALLDELNAGTGIDYRVYFSEVFRDWGGFDVVIGNPPYVRQELFKEQKPTLKKNFPAIYMGTADLLVYFYARGLELLRGHGTLALITSNKFMRAGYGKKLRGYLAKQTNVSCVIDFGDLPVFDATAYPVIVIVQRERADTTTKFYALNVTDMAVIANLPQKVEEISWLLPQTSLSQDGWSLVQPEILNLMQKLRNTGKPLGEFVNNRFYRGILTGYNQAFIVDQETRDRLVAEHESSAEILHPFLRGRDIKRWRSKETAQYLIKIESSNNKQHIL